MAEPTLLPPGPKPEVLLPPEFEVAIENETGLDPRDERVYSIIEEPLGRQSFGFIQMDAPRGVFGEFLATVPAELLLGDERQGFPPRDMVLGPFRLAVRGATKTSSTRAAASMKR